MFIILQKIKKIKIMKLDRWKEIGLITGENNDQLLYRYKF